MHGPDGTDYPEWVTWTEIVPPERIALLHGEVRDDPNCSSDHPIKLSRNRPPNEGGPLRDSGCGVLERL